MLAVLLRVLKASPVAFRYFSFVIFFKTLNLDLDPARIRIRNAGSGLALKRMRIHNTDDIKMSPVLLILSTGDQHYIP